ncbi:protein ANTI-SILENCING 1-like [Coffea arabica]|uniref:Protein ANTI-SILENCING 1-like n=1 Tax=Coffea arabica TaxID=13443 RepID=A0ABM4WPU0_COFAR
MPNFLELKEEEALEFSWGHKRCLGGTYNGVQFYDSFTYDGIEYSLYDCVYMWADDQREPYIGKLVKIWETASHKKKVKVVWFFRPIEIAHWLGDIKPLKTEIFLATGEGKGLFNLNPLEAISGKCKVVCVSKDPRNAQPTEDDLRNADYIFYRTFDVGSCKVSTAFADQVAGIEVKHYFNSRKVQKSILDTENVANFPVKDGTPARVKMKFSDTSASTDVPEIQAQKRRKVEGSLGYKEKLDVKDPFGKNISMSKGVNTNDKASKDPHQLGQNKGMKSDSQVMEVTSRLDTDSSKWFKIQSWDDRMNAAHEKGTLVLFENLDPSYTSTEVEDIVFHVFNQQVSAKMIQHSPFSRPNYGQAFVIFKTRDAADVVISQLKRRCLMLGDRRPVVGCRAKPTDPRNPPKFFGHISIPKLRLQKQHEDMRNAVSTPHYSQSNTVEFDMAMEWCSLYGRSKLWWEALHQEQAKETEALRNEIKIHCDDPTSPKGEPKGIGGPPA